MWALVSRLAFVGCLLLLFGGLALSLLPEFKALRATDEKIVALKADAQRLKLQKEHLEMESVLLETDAAYIEVKARDNLSLSKPNETVVRFKD
jgi:cell division protein FtsB